MRKVGILTGGGDCPGLNAVIRGVVEQCMANNIEVYGFTAGWRGALTGEGHWLTLKEMDGLQTKGGTILESSRTNIMKEKDGPERVRANFEKLELEGLVAIGGDDTLGIANKLHKMGMNMIGVPKTIDNDLSCTDYTFGFDTASNIAMECIDKLHTTAASHARCIVVECMGRHTGWIALQAGLAADAHLILIPEFPKTFDEIMGVIRSRYLRGERHTIIAVAEGFEIAGEPVIEVGCDAFGNRNLFEKDLAKRLADRIEKAMHMDASLDEKRKYFECRSVVLGHIQRGGSPSCFDRVLGTRLGFKAGELVVNGDYGNMVAQSGTFIVKVSLDTAVSVRKEVDFDFYRNASLLFK